MTKEEAGISADTFCQCLTCGCTIEQVGDCYVVSTAGIELTRFKFTEPVPVPKRYHAVIDRENNNFVYFSRGTINLKGQLNVSENSDCFDNDAAISHWEPVKIVRNGEHAKALELLGHCRDKLNGCSSVLTAYTISAFLADAEKAGDV